MLAGIAGIIIIGCVFVLFLTFGILTYRRRGPRPLTPRSLFQRSVIGVRPEIWDVHLTPTSELNWGDLFPLSAQLVPFQNPPGTPASSGPAEKTSLQINAVILMPHSVRSGVDVIDGLPECLLGTACAQLSAPMSGQWDS